MQEELINISFRNTYFQITAIGTNLLSDLRQRVCKDLNFDPKNLRFFSALNHSLINDNMTVANVIQEFGKSIELSELSKNEEEIENKSFLEIKPEENNYFGNEISNFQLDTKVENNSDIKNLINYDKIKKGDDKGKEEILECNLEKFNRFKSNIPSIMDFLYLHTTSPFPKPVGIFNLGNTCFFNAAIQCLIRVQPLTAYIMSPSFERQLNIINPLGSNGKIAIAYRNFLLDICNGKSQPRNPRYLKNAIASKYSKFANYAQHDSQELLCSLLDGLHEDLNQSSKANGNLPEMPLPDKPDSWLRHLSRNSSPIVDLFHGILYDNIKCNSCGFISTSHEPFLFLSLSISKSSDNIQLKDCINSFSKSEQLDDDNKWKCEKCKNYVRATKSMGIEKCPPVLIIHLKRFNRFSKIDTNIIYPDVIDISKFTLSKQKKKYQLIGVVFHIGGLNGGHYTSAAIDLPTNQWYYFNDSSVTKIDISQAHSCRAYILFYQEYE